MELTRIAELLEPFLGTNNATASSDHCHSSSDLCHSEERSDEEPAVLPLSQLQSISTYIDILLRWNARINLTAIRNPEDIVTRHFGESLFAAFHLFPGRDARSAAERRQSAAPGASRGSLPPKEQAPEGRKSLASTEADHHSYQGTASNRAESVAREDGALPPAFMANDRLSVADIGSGAGFPGLPIKLWAPQISLTLIESNHKKATFLREVARALTLTNINIQTTRVEQLLQQNRDLARRDQERENQERNARQDFQPPFDVVTLRAVERFPAVLPQAASLVASGGRLALLIGSIQQAHALATLPTFRWSPPSAIPMSTSRTLLIGTREPTK